MLTDTQLVFLNFLKTLNENTSAQFNVWNDNCEALKFFSRIWVDWSETFWIMLQTYLFQIIIVQ